MTSRVYCTIWDNFRFRATCQLHCCFRCHIAAARLESTCFPIKGIKFLPAAWGFQVSRVAISTRVTVALKIPNPDLGSRERGEKKKKQHIPAFSADGLHNFLDPMLLLRIMDFLLLAIFAFLPAGSKDLMFLHGRRATLAKLLWLGFGQGLGFVLLFGPSETWEP